MRLTSCYFQLTLSGQEQNTDEALRLARAAVQRLFPKQAWYIAGHDVYDEGGEVHVEVSLKFH